MHHLELTQAILLAGGRATRMRPYSNAMPKALIPLGGLALITRQLAHLAREGITHAVIATGYQHHQIADFCGAGEYHGLNLRYAVDPRPLGTAGATRYAAPALPHPDEPFLVASGAVLTDLPLGPLAERHHHSDAAVTMALIRYTSSRPVALEDNDGRIRGLPRTTLLPYWIDAGLWLLSPHALNWLPAHGDIDDSYANLAAAGLLASHRAEDATWHEITTIGDTINYPDSTT
ncbi:nucleotidyltransferase family protein [Streptomyces noursei]